MTKEHPGPDQEPNGLASTGVCACRSGAGWRAGLKFFRGWAGVLFEAVGRLSVTLRRPAAHRAADASGPRAHSPAGRQRVLGSFQHPRVWFYKVGESWELVARGPRVENWKEKGTGSPSPSSRPSTITAGQALKRHLERNRRRGRWAARGWGEH